jgi:hypothetical protein
MATEARGHENCRSALAREKKERRFFPGKDGCLNSR